MIKARIEINGLQGLLEAAQKELLLEIDGACRDTALELEGNAKKDCPVDTGRLRASIQTEKEDIAKYKVGTNVDYATAVHDGTRKQAAQPFLIGKNTTIAEDNLAKRIEKAIEKVVGK